MTNFKNRVFGAAIVKAVNSNYNADFSGQPRTLPSGTVYATDKAFKYTIKNYLKDNYSGEYIFYFKRVDSEINALTLEDAYKTYRKNYLKITEEIAPKDKAKALNELLRCIDVRMFGATFAMKAKGGNIAISIHGPVQINHGKNIWHENNIFSEQIIAPFRNPKEEKAKAEKTESEDIKQTGQTTIGRQSKLEEGHYLHHFSVNPINLEDAVALAGDDAKNLSDEDINKLKEAMQRGATYYDSASKAGTENELLIWVELNEKSKIVLPNFTSLITMQKEKKDGKVVIDIAELSKELKLHENEIQKIEIFRNAASIEIENKPEKATIYNL